MSFQFEALQANDGDCFLMHYNAGSQPGLILIDGGSHGVYAKFLRKRLEQIRNESPHLDLRLIMGRHIDADHITGILDLCKDLAEKQTDGQSPGYRIGSL